MFRINIDFWDLIWIVISVVVLAVSMLRILWMYHKEKKEEKKKRR